MAGREEWGCDGGGAMEEVLFRNVMVESVKSEVGSQAKHVRRIPSRNCVEPVTGSRRSAPHLDNGRKNPSKADKWRKLHYKRQHVESLLLSGLL